MRNKVSELKNIKLNLISIASFSIYMISCLLFSINLVKNNINILPYLIIAFFIIHIAYGVGYLSGLFYFSVFKFEPTKILEINR